MTSCHGTGPVTLDQNKDHMKNIIGCLLLLPVLVQCTGLKETDRPNILWITCEDISPYLGCYGFEQAHTPNLDRLAEEGIRYTRAYANAPVCAVSRSMLLTGMYSSTIGTHNMRCYTQLPSSIPAYPKIFKEAGYYCTNNVKKDYNSPFQQDTALWDESSKQAHFRNRSDGQPFFAVFNFTGILKMVTSRRSHVSIPQPLCCLPIILTFLR